MVHEGLFVHHNTPVQKTQQAIEDFMMAQGTEEA